MVYKDYKMKGYTLHTIKTDKFKIVHVEVIFRNNVIKEDIAKRNMLFDYLAECNLKYPTKRELNLELEDLYSASIYNVTSRIGNAIVSNFCMDFINPRLALDDNLTTKAFELLFEMIFNPLVHNDEFDNKIFEFVYNRLKNEMLMIGENPKKKAILRAMDSLKENPASWNSLGSIEDLEKVTPENLFKYYKEVLNHDYVDIYVVGDLDMDEVNNTVSKLTKFNVIKNHKVEMYVPNFVGKLATFSDKNKSAQSNIVVILNLKNLTSYEKKYGANMYNLILGGGSLDTKLYQKLRVQNSLCYNVMSMYQKYDNLIYITTSVDVNASKKAIALIKEAVKEMISNVSEEELNIGKALVKSSITMYRDNIGRIVDNSFYQDVSDVDPYDVRLETFNNMKVSDVTSVAKKAYIQTIYVLEGGK